ncbi:unnamed protein product [Cuscuta epithymum]|uniref:X8 domain-containing protein n=1 Tax=Cuscuta epithymum TaxID=186058 RepID=A0AAV0F080_9ASTE|nr:unnamed protein product [Cuscuta epithymum]
MAASALSSMVLLALVVHSSGNYCVCKDGVSDTELQKNIDYACGSGADCDPIHQNGACFNPNTVKDHCNYAVNSYYQRMSPAGADCSFSGTAFLIGNLPASVGSCVYPFSPGNGTLTPPGINSPIGPAPGSDPNLPHDSTPATHHKHPIFLTLTLVLSSLVCLRF